MISFGWSETVTNEDIKHGRVTKNFEVSDGRIRSATTQTKAAVYKSPVVKLAPVLRIDAVVFTKENRAGDVEAELSQYS